MFWGYPYTIEASIAQEIAYDGNFVVRFLEVDSVSVTMDPRRFASGIAIHWQRPDNFCLFRLLLAFQFLLLYPTKGSV